MRKRNKETLATPPILPSATELGDDYFYYEIDRGDETIAELMIRTATGARVKHTVIHVHSPESEHYNDGETAYVSRMAVGECVETPIEKPKRISKNPERTLRALARLTSIIKLHANRKKAASENKAFLNDVV